MEPKVRIKTTDTEVSILIDKMLLISLHIDQTSGKIHVSTWHDPEKLRLKREDDTFLFY